MFENCKTAEELKAKYKEAVKLLHPDNNPGIDTTKKFQEMQAEFSRAWDRLSNVHTNASGTEYHKDTTETAAEFMDIIEALRKMAGVNAELCGAWIWATGDTKKYKEELKARGFRWSKNKSAWYYHKEPYHKYSNRNYSMDNIRAMWGSDDLKKDSKLDA